jgi:hypothetical protein
MITIFGEISWIGEIAVFISNNVLHQPKDIATESVVCIANILHLDWRGVKIMSRCCRKSGSYSKGEERLNSEG